MNEALLMQKIQNPESRVKYLEEKIKPNRPVDKFGNRMSSYNLSNTAKILKMTS